MRDPGFFPTARRRLRAAAMVLSMFAGIQAADASPQDPPPEGAAEQPSAEVSKPAAPATPLRRHELTLYPGVVQLNVADTLHVGVAASYGFRVQERIALKVMPLYNYLRTDGVVEPPDPGPGRARSAFDAPALVRYGAIAGVELAALSGSANLGQGTATFDLMIDFGAGAGSTSVQLRPDSPGCETGGAECVSASYADAGIKLLSNVGAGVRVSLGERFMIRLEVRDLLFASGYSRLNGCTFDDVDKLDRGLAAGTSCRPEAFERVEDRPLARRLLEENPGTLTHLVSAYAGVGFLF